MPGHKINKAFILGAGLGTRMRPLTDTIPKPMVSVGGETLIRRALGQLKAQGLTDVTINTHYKADVLRDHLADIPLHWSHEPELLDTGGGIVNALPHFGGEDFFVIARRFLLGRQARRPIGLGQAGGALESGHHGHPVIAGTCFSDDTDDGRGGLRLYSGFRHCAGFWAHKSFSGAKGKPYVYLASY
ncbi:MAG: NTP transferase domain-containing protein [Alphaproteobacteria bacterium]|nr:NTP transferase domain-containing protein [Alphaproteobacteria bacterium]